MGTYDEKWQKERAPEPPEDFSFRFYNGAHPDLQVEGYLKGNEEVILINLTPEGIARFQLPGTRVSCTVTGFGESHDSSSEDDEAGDTLAEKVELNLDTLCLIPDESRFYMVWRGLYPVRDLTAVEVNKVNVVET